MKNSTANNVLIAAYMGWEYSKPHGKWYQKSVGNFYKPEDLKFHRDWNWLMLVCKKIDYVYGDNRQRMFSGLRHMDIVETYEGVVDFIKFWNDTSQKKFVWKDTPEEIKKEILEKDMWQPWEGKNYV